MQGNMIWGNLSQQGWLATRCTPMDRSCVVEAMSCCALTCCVLRNGGLQKSFLRRVKHWMMLDMNVSNLPSGFLAAPAYKRSTYTILHALWTYSHPCQMSIGSGLGWCATR